MLVYKSLPVLAAGAFFMLLARPAAAESILLGGIEDAPGSIGYEGTGDYNDLMFTIRGTVSVLSPSAWFSPLWPSMVDQKKEIYWDQFSSDGPDYNAGYCALGTGHSTG